MLCTLQGVQAGAPLPGFVGRSAVVEEQSSMNA